MIDPDNYENRLAIDGYFERLDRVREIMAGPDFDDHGCRKIASGYAQQFSGGSIDGHLAVEHEDKSE